jgi:small subunit ribosomal protein S17e
LLNKVRRLAEDLVVRYPALFSGDFDKNKEALAQVTVVRTRSLRNQLAGAITKIIHARGSALEAQSEDESGDERQREEEERQRSMEPATIEERARVEGSPIPSLESNPSQKTQEPVSSKEGQTSESPSSSADRDSADGQAPEAVSPS